MKQYFIDGEDNLIVTWDREALVMDEDINIIPRDLDEEEGPMLKFVNKQGKTIMEMADNGAITILDGEITMLQTEEKDDDDTKSE